MLGSTDAFLLQGSAWSNWNSSNFLRTGIYGRSDGYLYARVTNGNWWSTTSSSSAGSHFLDIYPMVVYPEGNNYRGHGFAVRCVVREG